MNTEDYFSVCGSGYAAQRRAGFEIFRKAISKRARTIGMGVSLTVVLLAALSGIAHNVMLTAKAGTESTVAQNHR